MGPIALGTARQPAEHLLRSTYYYSVREDSDIFTESCGR